MGFSPLAKGRRIPDGGRSSARQSKITGFTVHHQAGINAEGEATNPAREVSANYWIRNDGTILPHIDETRRAWTTGMSGYPAGAASDHRNITVEVSNSPEGVRTGTWAISPAARDALERLIGDVFKRHGLGKVKRGKNKGVAVHRDFVPTSCPGPYIMANLNTIIKNAEKHRTGKKESTLSAKNVWNYRGKDRVNKNASTQENKLSRIHQYVHQLRNLRKDVAGLIWKERATRDFVNGDDNANSYGFMLSRIHHYGWENRALLRGLQKSVDKLADELGKAGQVDPEQVKKAARDGVSEALADLEADVSLTINTEEK